MNTFEFNQALVDEADKIANSILAESRFANTRIYFFPKMINLMGLKRGVEVGVDQGGFSKIILTNSNIEKLYGVDIWQNEAKYTLVKNDLSKFITDGRYELIRDLSINAAQKFEDNSLDFCYIDCDHSMEGIYNDVRIWIKKVRIGGIISGHDYKDGRASGTIGFFGRHLRNKVMVVIDDFCPRYGYLLRTVERRCPSWWFIKNRECEAKLILAY